MYFKFFVGPSPFQRSLALINMCQCYLQAFNEFDFIQLGIYGLALINYLCQCYLQAFNEFDFIQLSIFGLYSY